MRWNGAPVSDAAGCPRRAAPRRPLNANAARHDHAKTFADRLFRACPHRQAAGWASGCESAVRAEGVQLLSSGAIDALAGDCQMLLELSAQVPGSRVVEGSVYGNFQALAVAKGRPAGLAYAKEFIEHARASGSVQQAIQRAG